MPGPIPLTNAVDAWTAGNAGYTKKNFGSQTILRGKTGGGDYQSWISFSKPFPSGQGSKITQGVLRLYAKEAWTNVTIRVQRVAAKWSVNTITHDNAPSTTGSVIVQTVTVPAGGEVAIDVASLMQVVADGGAWFGFRIRIDGTTPRQMHSAQSPTSSKRPSLTLAWVDAPRPPTMLSPSGGRAIDTADPMFVCDYTDPSADSPMAAIQVQIDPAANWTAPSFDSGEFATTVPQYQRGTNWLTTFNTDYYWRVRVKDAAGYWSGWSHTVNGQGAMFKRVAKAVVTITSPAAAPNNKIFEPTPPFAWTVSGGVQKHYQAFVTTPEKSNEVLGTSGKKTSTDLVWHPTEGTMKVMDKIYRFVIRVWDTVDREVNNGVQAYSEAFVDFVYAFDGTVVGVNNLAGSATPSSPGWVLTWKRTATPDFWVIMRDGLVVEQVLGIDLLVSGTDYKYTDRFAGGRTDHVWSVAAVVNGRMSATNPTVTGKIPIQYPWLMRLDGSDAIALMNPVREMNKRQSQELQELASNRPPVVVTQSIGQYAGKVSGLMMDETIPGVSADQMAARFESLREDSGIELVLLLVNRAMRVVAYNMDYQPQTSPSKVWYSAEFYFVQVDDK